MRKLYLVIFLTLWSQICFGEQNYAPADLNRQAQMLTRRAQGLAREGKAQSAFSCYTQALAVYEELSSRYPSWNSQGVEINQARTYRAAMGLGDQLYPLPEGSIEVGPDLSREGKRYQIGKALSPRVIKKEEGVFEVKGFTVELFKAGLKQGVRCNCPDFKYRGAKFNFPCKHIWAVLLLTKQELSPTESSPE